MSLAREWLRRSEVAVLLAAAARPPGTDSDAQKLQVHPGRLENLFAADPSKEQTRRAAERAGASLRAGRPITEQRCDRIPPFELTFTRVTKHHSFSLPCKPECSGQ